MTQELLTMFKRTIGDLSDSTELNEYYTNFLVMAKSQLAAEDISDSQLSCELGQFATVLTAQLIMDNKSVADNSTLILLRNLLAARTKGERAEE